MEEKNQVINKEAPVKAAAAVAQNPVATAQKPQEAFQARPERRGFNPQQRGRFSGRPQGDQRGFRRDSRDKKDDMESKLLDLARVSHTRAGGRRLRFRAIVVCGNRAGRVGFGVASGLDVAQAVEKATYQSKKNMIDVPIVNETIAHEITAKVGPAKVLLKPQQKGRGLIAGGVVRLICQLAGIKNISSKLLGTTKNKLNNGRATIQAFKKLKIQGETKKAAAITAASVKEEIKEAAQ